MFQCVNMMRGRNSLQMLYIPVQIIGRSHLCWRSLLTSFCQCKLGLVLIHSCTFMSQDCLISTGVVLKAILNSATGTVI